MIDAGFLQNAATPWTVLLVAGASGSGKSTIAQAIARANGVTWVQVDDLRLALQWSDVRLPSDDATRALYFFERTPDIWLMPAERLRDAHVAVGEAMSDAIAIVTGNHIAQNNPAVIEGDGILPDLLERPELAEFVESGRLKMVILDPSSEAALLSNMIERGRGMPGPSEDETRTMARASWLYAQWLKREAEARSIPVVACLPWETLHPRIDVALAAGATGSDHSGDEYTFDPEESPRIEFVSIEEGRRIFDRRARMELGISGEEFLRRWDSGEYPYPIPDDTEGRKIARLTMIMNLARWPQ